MPRGILIGITSLSAMALLLGATQAQQVTTAALLDEMIDLARLGRGPAPAYHTVQFSSYDRRAVVPRGEHWFGNSDGFGGEPVPGVLRTIKEADASGVGTYLLAEMDGPGAVVRCWTASHNRRGAGMLGRIRMYLDGADEPVFDGTANDFLISLYASLARQHGLDPAGLSTGYEQRDACYCPIPFARGCRIEWDGDLKRLHFYHIELRKYAEGTEVETFRPEQLDTLREKLTRVGAALVRPSKHLIPAGEPHPLAARLKPHQPKQLLAIDGRPGQITELRLKLKAADLDAALRQTVLSIYFDRFARPQVEAPLGDFFGAAPGVNPYVSVPMEVHADGTMLCRFVMPFAQKADLWVENRSDKPVELSGRVTVSDATWDPERNLHFYAQWRVNHDMQVPGRRGFDLPFAMLRGEGRFVGCSVHLMNPDDVPTGNWWGEGDEKIFVDDDQTPSFFGTGSEDYFNYSWSVPDLFALPYFAQPRCDGPMTRGFVANNRWHILDDIPFAKRLDFFMEMIHHSVVDGFSYARISYYYARPGLVNDQMPLFREDLRRPTAPEGWVPAQEGRQAQATYFQCEDLAGAGPHVEAGTFWAGGRRVAWQPEKDGDQLTLGFEVKKAGQYRLTLVMSCSPDAGRFGALLDGQPLAGFPGLDRSIDLYMPVHTTARTFGPSGLVTLDPGEHTLTFVSRGKSPRAKGNLIGADFFWIQP